MNFADVAATRIFEKLVQVCTDLINGTLSKRKAFRKWKDVIEYLKNGHEIDSDKIPLSNDGDQGSKQVVVGVEMEESPRSSITSDTFHSLPLPNSHHPVTMSSSSLENAVNTTSLSAKNLPVHTHSHSTAPVPPLHSNAMMNPNAVSKPTISSMPSDSFRGKLVKQESTSLHGARDIGTPPIGTTTGGTGTESAIRRTDSLRGKLLRNDSLKTRIGTAPSADAHEATAGAPLGSHTMQRGNSMRKGGLLTSTDSMRGNVLRNDSSRGFGMRRDLSRTNLLPEMPFWMESGPSSGLRLGSPGTMFGMLRQDSRLSNPMESARSLRDRLEKGTSNMSDSGGGGDRSGHFSRRAVTNAISTPVFGSELSKLSLQEKNELLSDLLKKKKGKGIGKIIDKYVSLFSIFICFYLFIYFYYF